MARSFRMVFAGAIPLAAAYSYILTSSPPMPRGRDLTASRLSDLQSPWSDPRNARHHAVKRSWILHRWSSAILPRAIPGGWIC